MYQLIEINEQVEQITTKDMNCQNELDPSVKYAAINDTKLNVIKDRGS